MPCFPHLEHHLKTKSHKKAVGQPKADKLLRNTTVITVIPKRSNPRIITLLVWFLFSAVFLAAFFMANAPGAERKYAKKKKVAK